MNASYNKQCKVGGQNSISMLQRAIEITFTPGVALLKSLGTADDEVIADEFNRMLGSQIALSKRIAEYDSGLKIKALELAGILIKEEINSGGKFKPDELLNVSLGLVPDLLSLINVDAPLREDRHSVKDDLSVAMFLAVSQLYSTFSAFPMGNDPRETSAAFLETCIALAREFASTEDEAYRDDIVMALLPGLMEVVQVSWGNVASAVLNPSGKPTQIKDVEVKLQNILYPKMVEAPLGHEGNETTVIRMIAGYLFDLAQMQTVQMERVVGAPKSEDYKSALLNQHLIPITPIAWASMSNNVASSVLAVGDEDMSEWLQNNASDPVNLSSYIGEVKRLSSSRNDPSHTVSLDVSAVKKVAEDRITTLFGIVSAVRSLLPAG